MVHWGDCLLSPRWPWWWLYWKTTRFIVVRTCQQQSLLLPNRLRSNQDLCWLRGGSLTLGNWHSRWINRRPLPTKDRSLITFCKERGDDYLRSFWRRLQLRMKQISMLLCTVWILKVKMKSLMMRNRSSQVVLLFAWKFDTFADKCLFQKFWNATSVWTESRTKFTAQNWQCRFFMLSACMMFYHFFFFFFTLKEISWECASVIQIYQPDTHGQNEVSHMSSR